MQFGENLLLATGLAVLGLAGCDSAPALPDPPHAAVHAEASRVWEDFQADRSAAFATYGSGLRVDGEVSEIVPLGRGQYRLLLAAGPGQLALGGFEPPEAYAAKIEPGDRLRVYCDAAAIANETAVLLEGCSIARDWRAAG